MVGFCVAEVKLFGPLHEYVAPETVLAVSDNVFPEQTGVLLPAVGAEGVVFTTTEVVEIALVQPLFDAVREYVPAFAVVIFAIVGFCDDELKPLGPFHE